MNAQVSQEVACIILQKIPCFADSMARSVSPGRPGPSLVHLTTLSEFPWDFDEVYRAQENLFFRALKNPLVRIVKTREDLIADEKTRILFGLRYPPDGMTLWRMRKLRECGIGVMPIADLNQDRYGSNYRGGGGLTPKGVALLCAMNECGVIPDLSGAGYVTALEVFDVIRNEKLFMRPMASHSGCYSTFRRNQDLHDPILRKISRMGGYIGIPYSFSHEFMIHARHAFKMMLGWGKIGVCTNGGRYNHFEIATDLAMENLDPRLFGQNFKEFLMRALPQT